MKHIEHRDSLGEALRALPRTAASEDFTDRVLAGLADRPPVATRLPVRPLWALVAVSVLVFLLAVGYGIRRQRVAEHAYQAQVEELRNRYRDLLEEVAVVRREAAAPDTRVYLGGDERVDLVLDLGRDPADPGRPSSQRDVRPASWEQ